MATRREELIHSLAVQTQVVGDLERGWRNALIERDRLIVECANEGIPEHTIAMAASLSRPAIQKVKRHAKAAA